MKQRSLHAVERPAGKSYLCERPRVVETIERAARRRVVLVQAAAGSGKSVAVRQFLEQAQRRYVWIAIDRLRATLPDFVLDVALALGEPWRGSVASAITESAKSSVPAEDLARWLAANGRPEGTIVVDDLQHVAREDPLWQFLMLALHLPDLRWFFLSRTEMRLPVTSLILAGESSAPISGDALAFTPADVRAAAEQQALLLSERTIAAIADLTQGWAAGVAFGLVAAEQKTDLAQISFETRELAFSYFAEQYFDSLDEPERRALYAIALAPSADLRTFEAMGFGSPAAMLDRLAQRVSAVERVQGGGLRIHALFRDFVLSAFERDDAARKELPAMLGRALEACGDVEAALTTFAGASLTADVMRLLESYGMALIEQGRFPLVERCLRVLSRSVQRDAPTAIGLRAAIEQTQGEFGKAQAMYERALASGAAGDFAWSCAYRLALLRANRWHGDPAAPIVPYVDAENVERRVEALTLAALGSVVGGRHDEARERIARALEQIDAIHDERIRAKVLMRSAYIAFYTGETRNVERLATDAAQRAERAGDFETATHCYSILYANAYAHVKEYAVALHFAQRMQRAAERCGSETLRTSAIRAQFEIEAQRGREERLEALDEQLRPASDGYRDSLAYLSGKALQFAWNGDFAHAVRLLFPIPAGHGTPSETQCALAQLAFYCAADDRSEEAEDFLERITRDIEASNPVATEHAAATGTYATLAMMLLGRSKAARRCITLRAGFFTGNDRAIYEALMDLTATSGTIGMEACGNALCAAGFGGLGRAISVLAARVRKPAARPLLTSTERVILAAIARGDGPKEISASSGRSYETVRSHIKAICRKLEASGMLEAVAAARRLNIL